ncbi:MAG: 1,4-alpha-glucan branching protein domain-containing protein, partial [Planctomycetota bacterium]
EGYPGDPVYREFYRDLGHDGELELVKECLHPDGVRRNVGLKYHRVTGRVPLEAKEPYDPAAARDRARVHARHFVSVCESRLLGPQLSEALRPRAAERSESGAVSRIAAPTASPVICAMYDAELFGHWWYEGIDFLREVLGLVGRGEASIEAVAPGDVVAEAGAVGASEAIGDAEAIDVVEPSASSWGNGGYFGQWLDGENTWIYPLLHEAEGRMVELARAHPSAEGLTRRALDQAARELLLAQASDWAFLMATRTAPEYAERRTRDHLARFTKLYEMLVSRSVGESFLADIERRDALFAEMDYRVYA